MKPGRMVLPLTTTILLPGGTATSPLRPTALMRLPSMTMTEFSIGARPVPSISVPPWMTRFCARAPCESNAAAAQKVMANVTAARDVFFMLTSLSPFIDGLLRGQDSMSPRRALRVRYRSGLLGMQLGGTRRRLVGDAVRRLHHRTRHHALKPMEGTGRYVLVHQVRHPAWHPFDRRQHVDIGERIGRTGQERMLGQCLLHLPDPVADLAACRFKVLRRKAVIGLEPFLALGMQRDPRQRLFKFLAALGTQDRADALRPADRRDGMKQVLVDDLPEPPHPRTSDRGRRLERRIRKGVVDIFVDDGRFGDDDTIMHQRRYLAVRIDGEIFGGQMITCRQPQEMTFIVEPLLFQRQAHLDRSLRQS